MARANVTAGGAYPQWVEVYVKNADIEARTEASRLEFETLRAQAPRTLEEAVERLADRLAPVERQRLASMTKTDLVRLHFTFGMWIRNAWLWTNPALVAACAADDPDDASGVLIRALWRKVRADLERGRR